MIGGWGAVKEKSWERGKGLALKNQFLLSINHY